MKIIIEAPNANDPQTVQIKDAETGEEITGVTRAEISLSADPGESRAKLEFWDFALHGEFEIVTPVSGEDS